MALLIANPELAVITTRDNPGLGQQLFLHYAAGEVVLEQTLPNAAQHRWALVPGLSGLVERLLGILPMQEAPAATTFRVEIPQEEFLSIKQQIESNQVQTARVTLRQLQWPESVIHTFIETLQRPVFGGAIAVLRCERREVVDARNLALVQGPQTALWMKQGVPGEPVLEVATVAARQVHELLAAWLAELQPVAS
jgi:hypothetical protein